MKSLGDRMKGYEKVWAQTLPNRLPVMARIDGICFSKLTKGMNRPYDDVFHEGMVAASIAVMQKSSGAILAYTHSDEITVLLKNDQTFGTEPHLGNRVQKLTSHLASHATAAFNDCMGFGKNSPQAAFDCRVWVNPVEEIVNQFLWRQRDAFKNCVSTVATFGLRQKYKDQSGFSAESMLHGKTTDERQEIIFQELGINMNDYPSKYRRGSCIINEIYSHHDKERDVTVERKRWVEDTNIPLFSENPGYIMDRYNPSEV